MIRDFKNEIWKPYKNEEWVEQDEYMFSNYGRVKRKKTQEHAWKISKIHLVSQYEAFWARKKNRKRASSTYVHRILAHLFCEKRTDHKFVIHLDFNKTNNKVDNLKWVSKVEMFEHHRKNPKKIARKGKRTYSKLTEGRVRMIKKKILDPNRRTRMKMIAKQFGISEMQLYRIKSGENWGYIKTD